MDVVIIGDGLIGSAIAWRLAERGCTVSVIGTSSPAAASGVAAGMLAPVTEATFTDTAIVGLNLASLARFADFAAELEAASGLPAGLSREPTLSVAADADDVARLRDFAGFLTERGMIDSPELIVGRELRRREPLLAPTVRAGLPVERDWSVDNRRLWAALREAGGRAGVRRLSGRVVAAGGGYAELADGRTVRGDVAIVAAGAWSGTLELGFRLPVRPVKGVIARLRAGRVPRPRGTVRAFSSGFEVYLVPRVDGEIVIGASVEDVGFDDAATAGAVYELLRDARRVLPAAAEYAVDEISVGFRPATPDNLPFLGASPVDGLLLATGHYRNGVLLTPITADTISALVVDGELPEVARPFGWSRLAAPTRPETVRN
ncbi:glycine oxidase [Naumannella cuiyingiana]|uniref:glycine oxidase n=1 Tax=Naumannella cuiyingiana TaxID=1347891 RepID=A0A7Z0DAT9_9ACTN|nr:glycine oxidase [Naumannella cuiyingiana]